MASTLFRSQGWSSPLSSKPDKERWKPGDKIGKSPRTSGKSPASDRNASPKKTAKKSGGPSPKKRIEAEFSGQRFAVSPEELTECLRAFAVDRMNRIEDRLSEIEEYSEEAYTLRLERKTLREQHFRHLIEGGPLRIGKKKLRSPRMVLIAGTKIVRDSRATARRLRKWKYSRSMAYYTAVGRLSLWTKLLDHLREFNFPKRRRHDAN